MRLWASTRAKSIKLAFVTGVFEYAEMTPIDFEALAGRRFHPQKGAVRLPLRASGVHILAQDGVPAGVTQGVQPLFHDGGRRGGVFFQPFGDGGFEGIEFALALTLGGRLRRRIQILLDSPPIDAQVALDLADRPVLGPVQAMQVVDLIGCEHGATSVIRQKLPGHQDVVVCKIPTAGVCGVEVLPESRLAPELSCCLQDPEVRHPGAKSLRRNALGQKLSCCLQDREDAVFGPELAAAGGSAGRWPGAVRDTVASNPGCGNAISEGCPSRLGDTPGPQRSSGDDNRRDGGAGNPVGCTPTAPADTSKAGSSAHNSGNCRSTIPAVVAPSARHFQDFSGREDLETAIECVLHPGRWLVFFDYKTVRNAVVLFRRQHVVRPSPP